MRWALTDSQPAEVTSSRGRALPTFTQAARTARMVQVQGSQKTRGGAPRKERPGERASRSLHPSARSPSGELPRSCWVV